MTMATAAITWHAALARTGGQFIAFTRTKCTAMVDTSVGTNRPGQEAKGTALKINLNENIKPSSSNPLLVGYLNMLFIDGNHKYDGALCIWGKGYAIGAITIVSDL